MISEIVILKLSLVEISHPDKLLRVHVWPYIHNMHHEVPCFIIYAIYISNENNAINNIPFRPQSNT